MFPLITLPGLFQAFRGLGYLARLELKEGSLQYIEPGVFSDTNNLIKLDLGDNSLTFIEEGALLLPVLEWLSLDGNSLASFPKDIARMTSLTYLDISYNRLETLARCDFVLLDSLEMVNLRQNPFRCDCDIYWLRTLHLRLQRHWEHHEMIPFVPGKCLSPPNLTEYVVTSWLDMDCLQRSKSLDAC